MLSISWFWFGYNHDMPNGVGLLHDDVFPVVYVFACHILKIPSLKMAVVRPGRLHQHWCYIFLSVRSVQFGQMCLPAVYTLCIVSPFSSPPSAV